MQRRLKRTTPSFGQFNRKNTCEMGICKFQTGGASIFKNDKIKTLWMHDLAYGQESMSLLRTARETEGRLELPLLLLPNPRCVEIRFMCWHSCHAERTEKQLFLLKKMYIFLLGKIRIRHAESKLNE